MDDARARVREAGPGDAAAVAEMANALAEVTYGRPAPLTAERVCADLLGRPGIGLLVAERGGAVAGYALWSVAYETGFAARGLYLADLFVKDGARGGGLGRALVAAVARRAVADGGEYVWLVAQPGNHRANALYDRLGASRETILARALFGEALDRLLAEG